LTSIRSNKRIKDTGATIDVAATIPLNVLNFKIELLTLFSHLAHRSIPQNKIVATPSQQFLRHKNIGKKSVGFFRIITGSAVQVPHGTFVSSLPDSFSVWGLMSLFELGALWFL